MVDLNLSIDTENSAEMNSDVENAVKNEYASASESPGSSKNVSYHENTASADEIVYINATAVLDNSPIDRMYGHPNNIKPLCAIIDSKDHIRRNVCKIKFGNVKTEKLENSRFKHEMEVTFRVKTQNLWENARSYLRKHFGGSNCKLQDGTELCFLRIPHSSSPP